MFFFFLSQNLKDTLNYTARTAIETGKLNNYVYNRTGRQKAEMLAITNSHLFLLLSGKPPNIKNWHVIIVCSAPNSIKSVITLVNNSDSNEILLLWFVHTLTAGTALMRPEHWVCTAGSRAGDEDTHLASSVAVTVPAAIMPALALFKLLAIRSQTVAAHWHRSGSANTTLTLWRENTHILLMFIFHYWYFKSILGWMFFCHELKRKLDSCSI